MRKYSTPHPDQQTLSFMQERREVTRPPSAKPSVVDRLREAGAENVVRALTTGQLTTADRMDDRPYARFAALHGNALSWLLHRYASVYAPDHEHQQRALDLVGRIAKLSGQDLVRELGQLGILEIRHRLPDTYAIPLHELKHLVKRLQREEGITPPTLPSPSQSGDSSPPRTPAEASERSAR